MDFHDRETARYLERMAQATGRWAEVIQTVNGWLKQQTEPKEKIRLCLHLAKWYGDDLGRPEYQSGRLRVVRMRTAVLLPAPFGPSTPRIAPLGTSRSSPLSATVEPYRLTRPCASIITSFIRRGFLTGRQARTSSPWFLTNRLSSKIRNCERAALPRRATPRVDA